MGSWLEGYELWAFWVYPEDVKMILRPFKGYYSISKHKFVLSASTREIYHNEPRGFFNFLINYKITKGRLDRTSDNCLITPLVKAR